MATSRHKPSQNDYGSVAKNLITKAIDRYVVRLLTISLFPDTTLASEWAADVWTIVCNEARLNFNPEDNLRVYKLVRIYYQSSTPRLIQAECSPPYTDKK